MTIEELEIRKFESALKIQTEELELKKKELELKIQEQKSKRILTPLVISIIGALSTILASIIINYFQSREARLLEDKKFQSSLLLKATEAKTYDEFSDMIIAFQENGLLSLDSAKLANFRRKRLQYENMNVAKLIEGDKQKTVPDIGTIKSKPTPKDPKAKSDKLYWSIVAGGAANLAGAQAEVSKSEKKGFKEAHIWYRDETYRTCIGKYASYEDAVNDLFYVKDKVNSTSYVVRFDQWCPYPEYDPVSKIYICK